MSESKRCRTCATEKPLDAFSRDRSRHDGLCARCKECDRDAYRRRNLPQDPVQATCVQCGVTFPARSAVRKYCTDRCRDAAKYERNLASGYEAVKVARRKAKYNSDPEYREAISSRRRTRSGAEARVFGPDTCTLEGCDRPHLALGLCKCHWRSKRRADGVEVSDETHRRRAERYGVTYESGLSWRLLLKEDGPACHICGYDVDLSDFERVTASGRKVFLGGLAYPSIDHVIPISRGGAHVRSNVRLAHRYCNAVKNDRLEAA